MPDNSQSVNELNWVDPDVVAYYEETGALPTFDLDREKEFKKFFETEWLKPRYDTLRERWDSLVYSDSPHTRVLGKTALWTLVQLRERTGHSAYNSDNKEPMYGEA